MTRLDPVKWYPLKPADFTARKTDVPAPYEAARDQYFVKFRESPSSLAPLDLFEHICCSKEFLLRHKSADELRWEYYQGNHT